MKANSYLLIHILALALLSAGCSHDIIDPEFDYNLKSAKVIETNNEFGLELLKTVLATEEKANVMISPTSVSIALGMAYNGAASDTREALKKS